jgi:hypothetical protein
MTHGASSGRLVSLHELPANAGVSLLWCEGRLQERGAIVSLPVLAQRLGILVLVLTAAAIRSQPLDGDLQAAVAPAAFTPPPCLGPPAVFDDYPQTHPYCPWMEQLGVDQISLGCSASPFGNFCPDNPLSRAEVAMMLEKAMRGTDTWSPGASVTITCADPGADCIEQAFSPVQVNIVVSDPGSSGNHVLRIWVTTDNLDTSLSGAAFSFTIGDSSTLQTISSNSQYIVTTGGDADATAAPVFAGPIGAYVAVEVDGRVFVSPQLIWF